MGNSHEISRIGRPERSHPLYLLHVLTVCMGVLLLLDLSAILVVSRYFNYGAEGIELAALLRVAQGLPYMTRIPDIPWFANQYSPYFYVIMAAPLKLMGLESLQATAFCARLTVWVTAVVLAWSTYRYFNGQRFTKRAFVFVSIWFCLLFPANIVAVRPDFLAFLVEFLAFVVWRRSDLGERAPTRNLLFAGLIWGCAIALKLNTVGILTGVLLYEAARRRWRRAFLLLATTLTTTALFFGLSWVIWGADALRDTFLQIQNQLEAPSDVAKRFSVLFCLAAPLAVLTAIGLRKLREERAPDAAPLLYALLASVAVATFQQAKAGAWFNYYYGAFALALAPAAIGVDQLVSAAARGRGLAYAALAMAAVHAAYSCRVPFVIARDRWLNRYPFPDVAAWLEREVPKGAIYSDDPSTQLHLQSRVLLGSNAEILLNLTPPLRPFLPQIRRNLSRSTFGAAVIPGPFCDQWRPAGLFRDETAALTRLGVRFGWICVFVPASSAFERVTK